MGASQPQQEQYRIRVRTKDGQEVISEVIAVAARVPPKSFTLRAQVGCFPLWTTDADGDPDQCDPEELELKAATVERLQQWAADFDKTRHEEDPELDGFASQEAADAFLAEGQELLALLQTELPEGDEVSYEPPAKLPVVEKAGPVHLVLKAVKGCDALWFIDEDGDLSACDLDTLPKLSARSRDALRAWSAALDAAEGGDEPSAWGFKDADALSEFQQQGQDLLERVQRDLGAGWQVEYQEDELAVAPPAAQVAYVLKPVRGCMPLWFQDADGDDDAVDLEILGLTPALTERVQKWAAAFDAALDGDEPGAEGFATQADADAFDREGDALLSLLQTELGESKTVTREPVELPIRPAPQPMAYVLKAERGCSPLWFKDGDGDADAVDVDATALSQASKDRLQKWGDAFDSTFDDQDPARSGFADAAAAAAFDREGSSLAAALAKELGPGFTVEYEKIELPIAGPKQAIAYVLKAERGCVPLWRRDADGDLDALELDLLQLSDSARARLDRWAESFEATFKDDAALSGFADESAAAAFRDQGGRLAKQLQDELGKGFTVTFDGADLPIAQRAEATHP